MADELAGRCATCRFWERDEFRDWPNEGACGVVSWNGIFAEGVAIARATTKKGRSALLVTRGEFGCVLHEPKGPDADG